MKKRGYKLTNWTGKDKDLGEDDERGTEVTSLVFF